MADILQELHKRIGPLDGSQRVAQQSERALVDDNWKLPAGSFEFVVDQSQGDGPSKPARLRKGERRR